MLADTIWRNTFLINTTSSLWFEYVYLYLLHFPTLHPVIEVTSSQQFPASSLLLTLGACPLPHLSNPDAIPQRTRRPDSLTARLHLSVRSRWYHSPPWREHQCEHMSLGSKVDFHVSDEMPLNINQLYFPVWWKYWKYITFIFPQYQVGSSC